MNILITSDFPLIKYLFFMIRDLSTTKPSRAKSKVNSESENKACTFMFQEVKKYDNL